MARFTFVYPLAFAFAATGCALHIPPPALKMQEKDVRFLAPGKTTRDELRHSLGPPNILDGERNTVYEWRTSRGMSVIYFPGPGGGSTGSNQSRLLAEFDATGKLRHFAFAEYRYAEPAFAFPGRGASPGPSTAYFVDGSPMEVPRPAMAMLAPSRALAGRDSREPGAWLWHPLHSQSAALAISTDGDHIAAAPVTGDMEVWNLQTGAKRKFASGFKSGSASAIDFSRDGRLLAAIFEDATVVWDMASAKRLRVFEGHGKSRLLTPAGPVSVRFAPDGTTVATGGRDGTVKLWDLASGTETSSFAVGGEAVQSLAFAPRGDLLAAGSSRGDVVLIDVASGRQKRLLQGSDDLARKPNSLGEEPLLAGRQVAFSTSGEVLAASDCVVVALWHLGKAGPLAEPTVLLLPYGRTPGCPRRHRTFVAFSPEDDVLVASSNAYSVWDLASRRLLAAWDPARADYEPADVTLGRNRLLAWNDAERRSIQVLDLAPIIRDSMRASAPRNERSGRPPG